MKLDWLDAMRRAVQAQRRLFEAETSIAGRTVYEGEGEGGDQSLALDRRAEEVVFAELDRLHAETGVDFVAISEERGEVAFGDPGAPGRVVIDPVDGSLNMRRTIPSFALSVAVASGPSMADVELGYVYDFGAGEEFIAHRGSGATVNGRALAAEGPGYGLEVVGMEAADPARLVPVMEYLSGRAYRVRIVGAVAIAACYVGAGRFDGMLSGRGCRSVDAAAAQLVVREAGGVVAFTGFELDEADLGLDARYPMHAALDEETLATVGEAQARAPE